MSERYVVTNEARAAVKGRETEVLGALGIDWRAGRPHLRCPYPTHADEHPSWRWDEAEGKAFCTCLKSHSIFDVASNVRGVDFDGAKLFVAELLSRPDLIRTKARRNGAGAQSMGAEALLNPPAEGRDDQIVQGYLASRLHVSVQEVPLPTTPIAGHNALAYFDPPAAKGEKPGLVGRFPCAVFGTVDQDGALHAQRIYLAPDGKTKADLGTSADGSPRDPKKSAKKTGKQSIAGLSVLWGAPSIAPMIILTEGIETGAAVALAMRDKVDSSDVAVAAAVSAAGMEKFKPWPATERVVVAADRDDGPKADGKNGSGCGERAARKFCVRFYETHDVAIALPGEAGEKLDWLDVLLRDGHEAIRSGVDSAEKFVPSTAEVKADGERVSRGELREVSEQYPLPQVDSEKLEYRLSRSGRVLIHKWVKRRDKSICVPVASPFTIPTRLRHVDRGDCYGLRVVVQDMNANPRCVDFDRSGLARMSASEIVAQLLAAGLRIEGDGEKVVVQALRAAHPSAETSTVSRSGWHLLNEGRLLAFITPGGDALGAPPGALELSANTRLEPSVATCGTLEGWQEAIEAALDVTDCPHWILGIVAGFAGPIVQLTGLATCGLSFSGLSTSGKSTAQQLAVSAWSTPDPKRPGLFHTLRTTENAVEVIAQLATGTILSLDELAHIPGDVLQRLIYSIAGGTGKRRLRSDATLKDSYFWATYALLSGECSLEEKVRADKGAWTAGMAVRLVDVDVTHVSRKVPESTLRKIAGINRHFGHAGPAFVKALIDRGLAQDPDRLKGFVLEAARTLAGGDADSALIRAANPFAILQVAGALARQFGLVRGCVDDAIAWAWKGFRESSEAGAIDPARQAVENIRRWLAERWDVSVKHVALEKVGSRDAVAWYDDTTVYLPTDTLREAAGNVLKEAQISKLLGEHDLLSKRGSSSRRAVGYIPKVGHVQAYALRRTHFGRVDGARADLSVVEGNAEVGLP